jgi:hypothetical protein
MVNKNTAAAEPSNWVPKGEGEMVLENSPRPKAKTLEDLRKQLQEELGIKSSQA